MKHLLAAALLAAAPAAAAQEPPSAAAPAAAPAADLDPQRLAAAEAVVRHIFPQGSYQRMMSTMMDSMMNGMMDSMFDMQVEDMVPEGSPGHAEMKAEVGDKTMRELMLAEDPHFEERMKITNEVMVKEMVPLMTRLEPDMQRGLARAYARKFSAAQLTELDRFFSTPTGHAYANESLLLWMDPEVMSVMGKLMPELVQQAPAIMAKVQAATAHLPMPEPRKGKSSRKKGR